ncbi:ubiquinone/menaquinone biosynthesis C-methylase UbiE/DNA-binding MarR family transcriptional regulator [Rhodopseudomonas julia]|uniref:Ubiquinone/menaquinone biosynthesis C-methylase UbiE/DNA-binding MarR family transcriptional regulator n=1 Tax=Rhodopseudomonas julia TaxID=200617 RepID=A0ABU0C8Y4_9BRAD|nr:metalloregulator ArsR/SmtB family transcription factor [Rhodopseudomonas julia]MDQ0326633.1 ubiquinone/menaquinone biosynthesis C-methylase UbiE/DNA-binding MarR family transcriptional regulator [Rhodopseudomonas julia]
MGLTKLMRAAQALADETRLRLVALLAEGERPVKELVEILGQSQPRISRHLKILTEADIIRRLPEGAHVYYRLASDGEAAALARAALAAMQTDPLRNETDLRRDRDRLELIRRRNQETAELYFARHAEEWDRLRSLHVPEKEVEAAIRAALSGHHYRSLLDIGTGTGRMLELLADCAERLTGIDRSPQMLALARTSLERAGLSHVRLRSGDALNLPLPRASFDVVVIHQVLHFLEEPRAALAEAARVLAPGGMLLVVDFAPHHLEFLRQKHAHLRLGFSDEQLTQWLSATALKQFSIQHLAPDSPTKEDEHLTVTIATAFKAEADEEAEPLHEGALA